MPKVIYKEAKEYYDSYQWEKSSYVTFIGRIKRNKTAFEIAILPWKLAITKERLKEKWDNYRNQNPLWIFYHNYEWDKPSFKHFKDKVNAWMSKEDAIKWEKKKGAFIKEKRSKQPKRKPVKVSDNESNYYIRVTYPKEEASVIRKVYIEKIEENEEKLLSCEQEDMNRLERETEHLKKELEVFNEWNPT